MVKHIVKHDHLPDYHVTFDEKADQVTFRNREAWWDHHPKLPDNADGLPALPPRVFEEARAAAPGYDVYELEQVWREWWVSSGRPKLDSPAAAFVGFCASRHKRAPMRRSA